MGKSWGTRMTDATLERLAREAGLHNDGSWWFDADSNAQSDVSTAALARFAALVRVQALEDAALTCEGIAMDDKTGYGIAEDCSAAIRALKDAP
jgi:hypothetical protein